MDLEFIKWMHKIGVDPIGNDEEELWFIWNQEGLNLTDSTKCYSSKELYELYSNSKNVEKIDH